MIKTIYKYQLNTGSNKLMLPWNAEILHVNSQGNLIALWALIDPHEKEMIEHTFIVFGTGYPIQEPHTLQYLGTAKADHGLIWHVFRKAIT